MNLNIETKRIGNRDLRISRLSRAVGKKALTTNGWTEQLNCNYYANPEGEVLAHYNSILRAWLFEFAR